MFSDWLGVGSRGAGRWRTVVAKRASRRAYKTGGGYWTRSDQFREYLSLTGETALPRSFGRSEGNRTSQLLVSFSRH